eukprot:5912856-Prymnesium_polylepis.1
MHVDDFGQTAADSARKQGHAIVEQALHDAVLGSGATAAANSIMFSPSAQGDPSIKRCGQCGHAGSIGKKLMICGLCVKEHTVPTFYCDA